MNFSYRRFDNANGTFVFNMCVNVNGVVQAPGNYVAFSPLSTVQFLRRGKFVRLAVWSQPIGKGLPLVPINSRWTVGDIRRTTLGQCPQTPLCPIFQPEISHKFTRLVKWKIAVIHNLPDVFCFVFV